MKKTIFFALLLLLPPVLRLSAGEPCPGLISPVDDRAYTESVISLIGNARSAVNIIMYVARRYQKYPDSPSNRILSALADAAQRNVSVTVILDQSEESKNGEEEYGPDNSEVGLYLVKKGISVYLDSAKKKTHAKLIIIDGKYTVVGSTNWTYSALAKNNETAVIIDSPSLADHYLRYFEQVKKESPGNLQITKSRRKSRTAVKTED